ncbi:MAG: GNAT family N-acetyltransferase [Pseudomonadota bacterium]
MLEFELSTEPSAQDVETVRRGLDTFGKKTFPHLPGVEEDVEFGIFARNSSGEIVGGLTGSAYWNAVHIEVLWVSEDVRGQDIGSDLLVRTEALARSRGFNIAYLDTSQAREFYEKNGYSVFGQIDDQPPGHTLYFMQKRLKEHDDV